MFIQYKQNDTFVRYSIEHEKRNFAVCLCIILKVLKNVLLYHLRQCSLKLKYYILVEYYMSHDVASIAGNQNS